MKKRSAILANGKLVSSKLKYITAIPLLASSLSYGIDVEWFEGRVTGSFDTTTTYGAIWRTEKQDPNLVGEGNYADLPVTGVTGRNDGNANFKPGLVSSNLTLVSELDLVYENYGAFVRAKAFYDEVIMQNTTDGGQPNQFNNSLIGNKFHPETRDQAGSNARFMDAYVWGDFDIGEMPLNVRLGEQVISWGESLFFQDGINQANPADLAALRKPGSEVKDALLPIPMLYTQLGITDDLTLEFYYKFAWEMSQGDPVGTFLSTSDSLVGKGAERVIVNFATEESLLPLVELYNAEQGVTNDILNDQVYVERGGTVEADNGGQFGFALRWFVEELNNTEFGFYFQNVHATKPVAGLKAGEAFGTAREGTNACATAKTVLGLALDPEVFPFECSDFLSIQKGTALSAAFGGLTLEQMLEQVGAQNIPQTIAEDIIPRIQGLNYIHFVEDVEYFWVFPEDMKIYGLSFNTSVGDTSLAGEIAFRPDAPMLAESGDNLVTYSAVAGLNMANGALGDFGPVVEEIVGESVQTNGIITSGGVQAGDIVVNMLEKDMVNLSVLGIHNFGKIMNADSFIGVLEVGGSYVDGLTDGILYAATDAYSYYFPLNPDGTRTAVSSGGTPSQYMDDFAWGYRLALSASYNDLIGGINVSPSLRFNHDVSGNSVIGGNYVEGRKSATLGFSATYVQTISFGASMTWFWGAEDRNQLIDRDHFSANVKYSF